MKLLTWNIQAGIGTRRYRDYLLQAHLQVVHSRSKSVTLQNIAREIAPYDVVSLQEVDLGGLRAGHRCQVDEIALLSNHSYVAVQENRRIYGISRHGNAILSRWPLSRIRDLKLPGRISGRGCLIAEIEGMQPLTIACLHLSLGRSDQILQLEHVANALRGTDAWVAMGDFNCHARSARLQDFCEMTGGQLTLTPPMTFPAWRPSEDFDHIVTSRGLALSHYRREPMMFSDHLPVSARIVV